jgi:hypothetical protein
MALLTPQAISPAGTTVTLSAPNASDTVNVDTGLIYWIKTGGTGTTVTIAIPGTSPLSGVANADTSLAIGTSTERMFYLNPAYADSSGVITITTSSQATCTCAVIRT